MAEKKQVQAQEAKKVNLQLDGKNYELSVDESLPPEFLQTKLKEGQNYVPINYYREIMRQLGEFGVPQFEEEKFMSGNNKYNVAQVAYKMKCTVEWFKDGAKTPIILRGQGYSSLSAGVLLSDAIHGNMMTLEAKALRAALRYSYKIFEFPEVDVYDDGKEGGTIKEVQPAKAIEEVAKAVEAVDENFDKIKEDYQGLISDYKANCISVGQAPEKKDILAIGTSLKEKYGEGYKKFIIDMIMPDINDLLSAK